MAAVLTAAACSKDDTGQDSSNQPKDWSSWTGDIFTVNEPERVEDCILRRSDMNLGSERFWTDWNFGASQVLDIGYGIAMWNMWQGHVLIRFDLRGLECAEAEGARLRIYKPKNVTQVSAEVSVSAYAVNTANAAWAEGDRESLPQDDAASWGRMGIRPWAGGDNGCGTAGVDHADKPLGSRTACKYDSAWLEFDIPKALINQWLDDHSLNAGIILKVDAKSDRMGNHVLFYSSEHPSGKGPELVIYGKKGPAKSRFDTSKKYNPRYVMPPQGSAFQNYLSRDNSRYKKWTIDPVIDLQGDQKIYPYYWDMIVDGEYVLPYSYYPFSTSIPSTDALIAADDRAGLLRWHADRLKYMHLWEYVREQRWYDCGDIIEVLSPRQAALIWLGSKQDDGLLTDGILTGVHPGGTANLTDKEIENRISREWSEIRGKVRMTSEQQAVVKPFIEQADRQRCNNYNICNTAAQRVRQLLTAGDDSRNMIDALSTFMNWHDVYLYYDSYYQIYRCSVLLENTDPASFTTFWKEQKYDEYAPARITSRFETAASFWPEDREPLRIENKNNYW